MFPSEILAPLVRGGKLRGTSDFSVIQDLDTVDICVPTPLRKTKDPDMSYIADACEGIARYAHPGMLIILESTTYPGTTSEFVQPMLEKGGLRVGQDIFLVLLSGTGGPWQSAISNQEHPQSGRRRHSGLHRARQAVLLPSSRDSCAASVPRKWPRWSSCWKTRSG